MSSASLKDQSQPLRPASAAPMLRPGPGALSQAAAFALPFIGCLTTIRGDAQWRSDAFQLAALEAPTELSGTLSAALAQATLALPLGSQSFRMATPGAFAAGLCGLAVLHLAHFLFRRQGGHSGLDPWLALGASLGVTFSLPWMSESSLGGGGSVGAALALCLLTLLLTGGLPRNLTGAAIGGVLTGALLSESLWSGAALGTCALLAWPEMSALPRDAIKKRAVSPHALRLALMIAAAALTLGFMWLPSLASRSAQTWALAAQVESSWPLWRPLDWIGQIGFLWTGGAVVAVLFSLRDRRPIYALASLLVWDFAAPGHAAVGWSEALSSDENRMALHLMALGVLTPLGALGLRTIGETAQALRLFAARPLAAMVAVLAIAGCLASAEDSMRTLEQTSTAGTQSWTDEALQELPHHSLVLTHSPAWGKRLLAAQAQGARPDVLVVPLSDLTRAQTLAGWLKKEPQLELLLRDLSVTETPSERAITRLVDERPVFVEPSPHWDKRLLEHLLPSLPLARFSPHALGRSDRIATLDQVAAPAARIQRDAALGLTPDAATVQVFQEGVAALSEVLKEIRDQGAVDKLNEIVPQGDDSDEDEVDDLSPVAKL